MHVVIKWNILVFTHLNPRQARDHGRNGRLFHFSRISWKMRESVLLLVVEKQVRELRRALPSPIMPLFLYAGQGWSINQCIGPEAGHMGWWGPIHLEVKKICTYVLLLRISPFLIKYPLKNSFIIVKISFNQVICGSDCPGLILTQLDIGKSLFKFQ